MQFYLDFVSRLNLPSGIASIFRGSIALEVITKLSSKGSYDNPAENAWLEVWIKL